MATPLAEVLRQIQELSIALREADPAKTQNIAIQIQKLTEQALRLSRRLAAESKTD